VELRTTAGHPFHHRLDLVGLRGSVERSRRLRVQCEEEKKEDFGQGDQEYSEEKRCL